MLENGSVLSGTMRSTKRRMFDGTSEKELMKAMSTYLNQTGAGDYNLPNLIGDKIHVAGKVTNPNWSFQSRTNLSWFPERHVDFQGRSSPPVTSYSPKPDN